MNSAPQHFETSTRRRNARTWSPPRAATQGVVLLIGDLGAGKTTLAKGIVEGIEAANADEVSSPTFTLIHEYGEPVKVYHADLYRLDTAEQVRRLGLEELFDKPAITSSNGANAFPNLSPKTIPKFISPMAQATLAKLNSAA